MKMTLETEQRKELKAVLTSDFKYLYLPNNNDPEKSFRYNQDGIEDVKLSLLHILKREASNIAIYVGDKISIEF